MSSHKTDASAKADASPTDNKEFWRQLWELVFGSLDPELEKWAHKVRASIPGNSVLNSVVAKRLIGVFKVFLEKKARNLKSPFLGAALKTSTDLADMVVAAGDGGHTAPEKAAAKIADDWMMLMSKDIGKRLEKAADPVEEEKKILAEIAARVRILEQLEAVMELAEEKRASKTAAHPKPTEEHKSLEINKHFASFVDALTEEAKRHGYKPRRPK